MENFVYHHPVKIIFGKNSLSAVGSEAAALGKRVLFVFGKSSLKTNGYYSRMRDALTRHNLDITELSNVQPNPLLSIVHEGIEKARQQQCDVVLAAGGGSVIDTAKSIAAGIAVHHDVWKFFTGKKSVYSRLPLITVPTIAGSGSEINHGIVITNDKLKQKFGFGHRLLIPDTCVADPALTCSVPPSLTAAGGVDILCHCLEPYLSTIAAPIALQKRFLEAICTTVVETVPACMDQPRSYSDRSTLLWCSMAAMSGIGLAGLGKVSFSLHALEHAVSALTGTAHGHGLAALLPGWLDHHRTQNGARLGEWGVNVFGVKLSGTIETADATIDAFRMFLQDIGCAANLKDLGISRNDFRTLTDHSLAQARIWRLPEFTAESVREILERCYRD